MRNYVTAAVLAVSVLTLAPAARATASGTGAGSAGTLYVDNQISGTLTPISIATNTAGMPIKTGNSPWSIVCAPTVCRSSSTAG